MFIYNNSFASQWFVDNNATGLNNGTSWDNAWESFSNLYDNRTTPSPGDTINISGGTDSLHYREQLNLESLSGTSGNITLVRVGQDASHNGVVICSPASGYGMKCWSESYITVSGNVGGNCHIKIDSCNTTGVSVGYDSQVIILEYLEVCFNGDAKNENGLTFQTNTDHLDIITLRYSKIHDNYQDQMQVLGPGTNGSTYGRIKIHDNDIYNLNDDGLECNTGGIDFYNNLVHGRANNGGSGHPDGIQFFRSYTRVWNNKFYNFSNGSQVSNSYIFADMFSDGERRHVYIYNNLIYDTGQPISGFDPLRGIAIKGEPDIDRMAQMVIANNTIVGIPAWGMTIGFNSKGLTTVDSVLIVNNIVYNCYKQGGTSNRAILIYEDDDWDYGSWGDGADVTIDYTIIHPGDDGEGYNWPAVLNDNGLTSAPSLDANYSPDQINDPPVDAGVSMSSYYTTDIDGVSRPQNSSWDMGAFEYIGNNLLPSPPENVRINR